VAEPAGRERAERAFAEAAQDGSLGRLRRDLFALTGLLRTHARLRKVLGDIAVPPGAKGALLRELLGDRVDARALSLVESFASEDGLSWRIVPVLEDAAIQAVLAEAEDSDTLGEVEDELFRFARLLESEGALRSALSNPVLPHENKRALLDDLLAGNVQDTTMALIGVAVSRPGDPLERIATLIDRAAARRGRVVVEARTAVELDAGRRERLSEALSRVTGRQVDLELVVDPSVVGGVVARVGDEVIDGSVRRKLELALERLST
jgi:F-type H+-transporting ATPase subunit delta